ncbi:MAG TPA: efflux RND transporter periplasmic adaptor subunit [Burkholderiaceae bacterium]|nr:efflux RND transporter periplasmic adaptor subunit [Burkholderiaceae bacterium]
MRKRAKIWTSVVVVLGLATAAVLAVGARKGGDEGPRKPDKPALEFAATDLTRLKTQPLDAELALPGSVQALNQATVRAKLSAEVRRVLVREGETVTAGQPVAEFDTTQLRAQLAERQATYESARAQLANTERVRQANAALVKQNFISQNAFDNADSNHQAQLATVAAARAALEQTQIMMNDATVRSPIAGVVAKRHVQPGEKVGYDAPLLAVVDLSRLEVQAQAPVSDVPLLARGQAATIEVEGLPGRRFQGTVERINPATEAGTRMVNLYVSLPNEGSLLKAGMFSRVYVQVAPEAPVPTLPLAALRGDPGGHYVWVIAEGKLVRRPVETGRRDERGQRVEVRGGVAPGDAVLATKFDNLREGQAANAAGTDAPKVASEPAAARPAAGTN